MEFFNSFLNKILWSKKNDTNGEEIPGVDPVVRLNEGNLVLTNGDPNKLDSFGNSVKASFVDMEFMNAFISLVGESVIGSERKVTTATNNLANHKFLDWRPCDGSVIGLKADYQPYADLFPEYVDGLNVKTPDYRDKILKMKGTTGSTGGSDTTDVAYTHNHTSPAHSHANTVSDNIWFKMTGSINGDNLAIESDVGAFSRHFRGNVQVWSGESTGAYNIELNTGDAEGHEQGGTNSKGTTKSGRVSIVNADATTTVANSTGGSSTKSVENAYLSTAFYICVGIKKDAFKHAGNP